MTESEGFTSEPDDVIDMGFLSLPADIQAAVEQTASLHARIDAALQDSMDRCARCKTCDAQVDAVMAAVEPVIAERDAEIERLTYKLNAITESRRPRGPLVSGTFRAPDSAHGTVAVSREDLRRALVHVTPGAMTRADHEAIGRLRAAQERSEGREGAAQ